MNLNWAAIAAWSASVTRMNDKNKIIFRNLLVNVAGVGQDTADIISDSVLDWKEPDNMRRANGAGDEYYLSLPDPYKPRHASFKTLDELLMVRGMTADILYGNAGRKGIMPYITIYSQSEKINIMTAPCEVLAALPGLGPDMADKIISMRNSGSGEGKAGPGILSALAAETSEFVFAADSGEAMRIQSNGYSSNEKTGFKIYTVVTAIGTGKPTTLYYKAPAYSR